MVQMYGVTSPSDTVAEEGVAPLQRAKGAVSASFQKIDEKTRVKTLHQSGCGKARLPNVFDTQFTDLVGINTSGGLTGGDVYSLDIGLETGSKLRATTQACEKIYRASTGRASVTNHMRLEAGASLHWLPQETIFFDGGELNRELHAEISADSEFIAFETLVFGRKAMGETQVFGALQDQWRVFKEGQLIYAEDTELIDDLSKALAGISTAKTGCVTTSGIMIGKKLPEIRDRIRHEFQSEPDQFNNTDTSARIDWGCSYRRDALVFRAVATDSLVFRTWMSKLYQCLTGLPLPRPWNC